MKKMIASLKRMKKTKGAKKMRRVKIKRSREETKINWLVRRGDLRGKLMTRKRKKELERKVKMMINKRW